MTKGTPRLSSEHRASPGMFSVDPGGFGATPQIKTIGHFGRLEGRLGAKSTARNGNMTTAVVQDLKSSQFNE